MKVQIITTDNGVGLTHDIAILKEVLHEIGGDAIHCTFRNYSSPRTADRYDINFFLELVNPNFFGMAELNYLVPNPEWFIREWGQYIRRFDGVLCKTHHAEKIFRGMGAKAKYVGWTSTNLYRTDVQRKHAMLHVAGKSSAKGTSEVLEAMAAMPEHKLTMITSINRPNVPANVHVLGRVDQSMLTLLMNQHRIHLCPSAMEGFGHYINEARSVGAVVITTNAAPMSELITPDIGMGAAVKSVSVHHASQMYHVDPASLVACIQLAMRSSKEALESVGNKARAAYLRDREAFTENLRNIILP